jgi:uncharacterized repeat protein (TIGR03803 family)
MPAKNLCIGFALLLAIFAVITLIAATPAAAQTEKLLHSFNYTATSKGPFGPQAGLIFDADGNLYGTATNGGPNGGGAVFELTRTCGGWTEKTLHVFGNGEDGYTPFASLISDAHGNLYGTTYSGGVHGQGTVFELSRTADGDWTEKILHNFEGGADGYGPVGGLIFGAAGNLYGTASWGGDGTNCPTYGCGTVFELSPTAEGGWTEKIIHHFGESEGDGALPHAGMVSDAHGNLYGTTYYNSSYSMLSGTVFELSPAAGGVWSSSVLHYFGLREGGDNPQAGLAIDAAGNLYGTAEYGGAAQTDECLTGQGCGVAFKLSPSTNGWAYTVLFNFNYTDGAFSFAGLTLDKAGNLYGTTYMGGPFLYGTVFELSPTAGGEWTQRILHKFPSFAGDGSLPVAGLIFDAHGNLYSTSSRGGAFNYGTVFEITP